MKTKQLISLIAVTVCLATSTKAALLEDISTGLGNVTNWAVATYGTYAPDSPKKYGGGLLAVYNVNNNFGAGIGVDVLGSQFNMVSGDLTLKASIHPFTFLGWSNVVATPFLLAGIGTPMGGAGKANGNVSTIAGAGTALDVFKIKGFQASIGYEYSLWSGAADFSGAHHHIFFGIRKAF